MSQRTYPAGVPCWVDTEQPDFAAAKAFYGELFGWSFDEVMPSGYAIASLHGLDVAGIGAGEGAAWNTYVAVDDVDATAALVPVAGGAIASMPADAGPGGRQAGCADPEGAGFRLWQSRERLGAQLVNAPGTWNFSDLRTADPAAAQDFYGPLFGWEFTDMGFAVLVRRPGYGDHLEATVDPGIRKRQEDVAAPPGFEDAVAWIAAGEGPAGWGVTFAVADRDAAAATAERLGAAIVASDDTEWTRTAQVRDPQGAELVLSQFTPPGD
jgi:predicted enzyme related to lactoylglutathione lyase